MDDIAIIENKIYEIRGQKVMLDFDLAEMYGVETKRLKEQVRRNIERFPAEFMFELTKEEVAISRSQIATLKTGQGYNIKYLPFAFTEYGIVMLSSVLKSKTAVEVNINIIRAFVWVTFIINSYKDLPAIISGTASYAKSSSQVGGDDDS